MPDNCECRAKYGMRAVTSKIYRGIRFPVIQSGLSVSHIPALIARTGRNWQEHRLQLHLIFKRISKTFNVVSVEFRDFPAVLRRIHFLPIVGVISLVRVSQALFSDVFSDMCGDCFIECFGLILNSENLISQKLTFWI